MDTPDDLTLLDYIAVRAMQALIDKEFYDAANRGYTKDEMSSAEIASAAYDYAEAMLAEKEKR